jgi:hypothetical protein
MVDCTPDMRLWGVVHAVGVHAIHLLRQVDQHMPGEEDDYDSDDYEENEDDDDSGDGYDSDDYEEKDDDSDSGDDYEEKDDDSDSGDYYEEKGDDSDDCDEESASEWILVGPQEVLKAAFIVRELRPEWFQMYAQGKVHPDVERWIHSIQQELLQRESDECQTQIEDIILTSMSSHLPLTNDEEEESSSTESNSDDEFCGYVACNCLICTKWHDIMEVMTIDDPVLQRLEQLLPKTSLEIVA